MLIENYSVHRCCIVAFISVLECRNAWTSKVCMHVNNGNTHVTRMQIFTCMHNMHANQYMHAWKSMHACESFNMHVDLTCMHNMHVDLTCMPLYACLNATLCMSENMACMHREWHACAGSYMHADLANMHADSVNMHVHALKCMRMHKTCMFQCSYFRKGLYKIVENPWARAKVIYCLLT